MNKFLNMIQVLLCTNRNFFPQISIRNSIIVNFFWHEKVLLLLDSLQLFGLLWVCAQPWPWPFQWGHWTRWIVVFNLDVFSLYPTGALAGRTNSIDISLYGNIDDYIFYALAFGLVELSLIAISVYLYFISNTYAKSWVKYKSVIVGVSMYIAYILYIPLTLALFRLYDCSSTGHLNADPTMKCNDPIYLLVTALCSIIHLPVALWVPYWFYDVASQIRLYELTQDHEKRIQVWELMFIFDLNDEYLEFQCWAIASFKRKAIYFRSHMVLLKLTLLLIFIGARQSAMIQALLFLLSLCIFFGFYGLYRKTFRCYSTQAMLVLVSVVLIVDCSFGLANAFGVSNFLMVSSTESITLLVVNVVGAALLAAVLFFSFFDINGVWPSFYTLKNLNQNSAVVNLWLRSLLEANKIKFSYLCSAIVVADIDALEQIIRNLQLCWLSAASRGSIFTLAISETLEELIYIHSSTKDVAARRLDHWNNAYIPLANDGRLQRRHSQYLMMAPRKRRILNKLLALKTLTEGVKVPQSDMQFNSSRNLTSSSVVQWSTEDLSESFVSDTIAFVAQLTEKSDKILNSQSSSTHSDSGAETSKALLLELSDSWGQLIKLLESGEMPPHIAGRFTEVDFENWYTYNAGITQLLENQNWEGSEEEYGSVVDLPVFTHNHSEDELDRLLGLHPGFNPHPYLPSDSSPI